MRGRRFQRGATITEVAIASAISTIVLFGAVSTFLVGMSSWMRGQGKLDVSSRSQIAVRTISQELREAMSITVDGDGMGVTYRRPRLTTAGDIQIPVLWDGVARRIELRNGVLRKSTNGNIRVLARGLTTTDPRSRTAYRVFTAGSGSITRQVHVQLANRAFGFRDGVEQTRVRETIYLRNIPELAR